MTEDERRTIAKQTLESLEFWLRRFIHEELSKDFGADYINAKTDKGDNLIKGEIVKKIITRKEAEPERYPRLIDASLLEHQIDIICNPSLYNKYFAKGLQVVFPDGREEAKTFLERLEYPRNCLAHANPISLRQYEQVICYSHDAIDSLKEYYVMSNKASEFNVPRIIKATDHFGNVLHLTERGNYQFYEDKRFYLWPGDKLMIEIEVDQTFEDSEYDIMWYGTHFSSADRKLTLTIDERHVSQCFQITCRLTTKKNWHKYQMFDDQFHCNYKVLPPRW